jgi:hypothetical protein
MASITEFENEQIAHSIDHIGQKYGLKRYHSESTYEFKKRVLDTFIHRGNPTGYGVVSTTSRALGTPVRTWFSLKRRTDGDGVVLNPYAGIIVTNISIQFYDDVTAEIPSNEFFFVKKTDKFLDTWWYASELIEYINDSDDWEFDIQTKPGEESKLLQFLVPSNSFVRGQSFRGNTGMTYLLKEFSYLPESLQSNSEYLVNPVASFEEVLEVGDYFFDTVQKIIYTKEDERRASFDFSMDTFVDEYFVEIAPISYKPLCDPKFKELFTERVIGVDNISIEAFYLMNNWLFYVLESMKVDKTMWIAKDANKSSVDVYGESRISATLLDEVEEFYFSKPNENFRNLLSRYGSR